MGISESFFNYSLVITIIGIIVLLFVPIRFKANLAVLVVFLNVLLTGFIAFNVLNGQTFEYTASG